MVDFTKNSTFSKIELLDLYIVSSLISSVFLWFMFYSTVDQFAIDSFFLSTLVVANFLAFSKVLGISYICKNESRFQAYFLGQFFCLLASAFQFKNIGLVFISFIPCLAAAYNFKLVKKDNESQESSGTFFLNDKELQSFGIGVFSLLSLHFVFNNNFLNTQEWISISSFCFWSFCLLYWGSTYIKRENKSFLTSLIKSRNLKNYKTRDEVADKLFFHDIINQTHGLNLFLNYKIGSNESLESNELKDLSNEIKSLEQLIQNHYGLEHRNLTSKSDFKPFEDVKKSLMKSIENYLPKNKVKTHYLFKGEFENSNSRCLVPVSGLQRIISNIVKNISEQNSTHVEIEFDFQDYGLYLRTKNNISKLSEVKEGLEHQLSEAILNSNSSNREHLGLESISRICDSLGGSFTFFIQDGHWINEVFIPISDVNTPLFADKIKNVA